ncbi:TetR/AcrR family transcriptional regulator [Gordonia lacunae]|uniref:TetR family transcriptional regulator n=1 Tax=Gordonia lacunae TaxID=417102 RepID=A0A243Q2Y5_9ACTN|nr:TetR/AcrR family transcriptional regulator [Gordonia lacunae]OUC75642.1 TetR family transcriptional regulator [Gordonia lacunae]
MPDHGSDTTSPDIARRPGGRTARVRRDVLDATLRHIADRGLDGLTVATIASAAGVAQTTVYRRWPTPPSLVADALEDLAEARNPMPDTGSLRRDLHQLAEQIAGLLSEPAIARLLGSSLALSSDPEVDSARMLFWDHRFQLSQPLVDRAISRGEIRTDAHPREVIETLVAPLYFRLLVTNQPIGADLIDRCVDTAMAVYGHN